MSLTSIPSIVILLFLGVHMFVDFLCAVMVYINQHAKHDRAWRYLFTYFVTSLLLSLGEIVIVLSSGDRPSGYRLMDPIIILFGFVIFAVLMCYIIELLRAQWLSMKRIGLIILPWAIFAVLLVYYMLIGEVRTIYSLEQLLSMPMTAELVIRIILSCLFVPYAIWLFLFRFNWKFSTASRALTNTLLLVMVVLCITYIGSRGLQFVHAYLIHEFLCIVLGICLVYIEYYERLQIPQDKKTDVYVEPEEHVSAMQVTMNHVTNVLDSLISDPNVWQNPDLTCDHLAYLVGTNRTYLQQAAKQKGYASTMDMIHHIRIDYVCRMLLTNPSLSVHDIFYDAGYRSRSTAWRNFVAIVGCTPTEFVQQHSASPLPK